MKKFLFLFIISLFLFISCHAQNINKISSRCAGTLLYSQIEVQGNGDIYHRPCNPRTSFFFGNVDFSNATVTGLPSGSGNISGTLTANRFPFATNSTTIANSPYIWDTTSYSWNNTALNSTFSMLFTPDNASGAFKVGHFANSPNYYFTLLSNGTIELAGNSITLGDAAGAGNSQTVTIDDVNQVVSFQNSSSSGSATFDFGGGNVFTWGQTSAANFSFDAASGNTTFALTSGDASFSQTAFDTFLYNRTLAASTGNTTINKAYGSVQFAAATSDLTVTNATATTTSLIFCTVQTNDTTAKGCYISNRANGSFHIQLSAAATATTVVAFQVTN